MSETPAPDVVGVVVEQALGPGIDFERTRAGDLVGRRARRGGAWLGFDRAALAGSDDGTGRAVPVLVAVPSSTFPGARLEVGIVGGWCRDGRLVLVGAPPAAPPPLPAIARVVAGMDDGATWLGPAPAALEVLRARQRYRERESHARVRAGRAWLPGGILRPEAARFATPHSQAEYRLSRLPPRFLRGFEGLLDDEERLLYWVERRALLDVGVLGRLRRRDRRAALLALTDRQLLWIVDHTQPDQYLSDWGIDVELVPVERVVGTECTARGEEVTLRVETVAGPRSYRLPAELTAEVRVIRDLLHRFTPGAAGALPRRRYPLEPVAFDREAAERFGQGQDASTLHREALMRGDVLAFLFNPRRPGHRSREVLVLRPTAVELDATDRIVVGLAEVPAIELTLSPLIARVSFGPAVRIAYPGPLADRAASFVRLARRAVADIA